MQKYYQNQNLWFKRVNFLTTLLQIQLCGSFLNSSCRRFRRSIALAKVEFEVGEWLVFLGCCTIYQLVSFLEVSRQCQPKPLADNQFAAETFLKLPPDYLCDSASAVLLTTAFLMIVGKNAVGSQCGFHTIVSFACHNMRTRDRRISWVYILPDIAASQWILLLRHCRYWVFGQYFRLESFPENVCFQILWRKLLWRVVSFLYTHWHVYKPNPLPYSSCCTLRHTPYYFRMAIGQGLSALPIRNTCR